MRQYRRAWRIALQALILGLLLGVARISGAQGQPGQAPATLPASAALALYAVNPFDPINMLIDPAGDLWFSSYRISGLGRLVPATGQLTSFDIPGNLWGLQRDQGGGLWFSTGNGNVIGRLDPVASLRQEWSTGVTIGFDLDISPGGDVWFDTGEHLARLTVATNTITTWAVYPPLIVGELQSDANGDVWFTSRPTRQIARFSPQANRVTAWLLPADEPYRLDVEGPDSIWVSTYGATQHSIVQLIPSTNTLRQFAIPTPFSGPGDLIRKGDSVWFTEGSTDQVGRLDLATAAPKVGKAQQTSFTPTPTTSIITPTTIPTPPTESVAPIEQAQLNATVSGGFAEFKLPLTSSVPIGMTADQSTIWFGTATANRIGRILSPPPALAIAPVSGAPGSFFQVAGSAFPSSTPARVVVNGRLISDTLATDTNGAFAFQLDTSTAQAGRYLVTVSGGGFAVTAQFTLDPALPVQPQQGGTPILTVPAQIAFTRFYHLPLALR